MTTKSNKFKSINFKTLTYFVIFSISIALVLLVFQLLLFGFFYEQYQINSLDNLANTLINNNRHDMEEVINNISFNNNICLEYVDTLGYSEFFNDRAPGCLLKESYLQSFKKELDMNTEQISKIRLVNPKYHRLSYLYSVKLDFGTIYIFSVLTNVSEYSLLMQREIIYIALIAIIFAVVISYFLSKKLSKPITKITSDAKELADGNYSVSFAHNGILELDELSDTLNYLKEEVLKVDEYRRDLMANVSHDLKTPLTMIKAYAEMIRDISYKDEEKMKDNLNIIIDEVDRLNILVNDILELSKLQSKDYEKLNIEEFDLGETIKDILKRYDLIKEIEDYHFIVEIPDKVIVKADKKRLEQVIYNLINNAINYTGEDKLVYISIIEDKKEYIVSIKDTGKGISKKDLEHIWDKYYKNEKNHHRNIIGTGLGLAIVKNILLQHNFTYGVNSKKNKGTEFYFKINK